MLRLEVHAGLGNPLVVPCRRVLVRNAEGTVVAAVLEREGGAVECGHAGEGAAFARLLAQLGLDRTEVAVAALPDVPARVLIGS